MASGPPGGGSILPDGWTWDDVGHGALDIAGLVPGIGEGADLTNAAWYAAQNRYLEAGLSIVSMVPIVGDLVGKGGKALGKLSGPALEKVAGLVRKMDFDKMLAPLAKHPVIGPKIAKIGEALNEWRDKLVTKAMGCTACDARATKALGEPGRMVGKTPVPERILAKMTPVERATFDKALAELENFPVIAAKDRAVFYSGMVNGTPAWKLVEQMEKAGTVDSVNTLTKGLLNRPSIRDILPDDAMGFVDDLASRKLADGASGVLKLVGDPDFIKGTSVFRRIELPALLDNAKIAPESRKALLDLKRFLDAKYGS